MKRPAYDAIAARWDEVTGDEGGPYKRLVLNEALAARLPSIDGARVLEVGAGTGYFSRWLCARRRGRPASWILADLSLPLLRIAARRGLRGAPRVRLDAGAPWPFPGNTFDLVASAMMVNELPGKALRRFLAESARVLARSGRLVFAELHPKFLRALAKNGDLRNATMPGPAGLRLPVVARDGSDVEKLLVAAGFRVETTEVATTEEFLREKPDIRFAPAMPRAVIREATLR